MSSDANKRWTLLMLLESTNETAEFIAFWPITVLEMVFLSDGNVNIIGYWTQNIKASQWKPEYFM